MNETLKEIVELMNKAKILSEVMDHKNAELQEIVDTNNESKFRRMCKDLDELKEIFLDLGLEDAVIHTPIPIGYKSHIVVRFYKIQKGFQIHNCSDELSEYGSGIYLGYVSTDKTFSEVGKQFCSVGNSNRCILIKSVELLMNNWDAAYEQIQNEFAKVIQRKINLDITNKIDKYNALTEKIKNEGLV